MKIGDCCTGRVVVCSKRSVLCCVCRFPTRQQEESRAAWLLYRHIRGVYKIKRFHFILTLTLAAVLLLPGCDNTVALKAAPTASLVSPTPELDSIKPLFDFYNLPSDWPKGWVVPLMNEFKVTAYKWSGNAMYAAGYGAVSMSRASNYYTNAQKIHVSTNIWEQDPENPSDTEGVEHVFHYVSERKNLKVVLRETDRNRIYFELYYCDGAGETEPAGTGVTTDPE